MDWNLAGVIANFLIGSLNVSVVIWNAANWRDNQSYKAKLDKDIESFKADLRAAAFQREVKLTALHTRRGTVLSILAGLLADSEQKLKNLTFTITSSGMPSKEDRFAEYLHAFEKFRTYFRRHRVYLSPKVCEGLDTVILAFVESHVEFEEGVLGPSIPDSKAWIKASKLATEEIPHIRADIENEFRTLLGV